MFILWFWFLKMSKCGAQSQQQQRTRQQATGQEHNRYWLLPAPSLHRSIVYMRESVDTQKTWMSWLWKAWFLFSNYFFIEQMLRASTQTGTIWNTIITDCNLPSAPQCWSLWSLFLQQLSTMPRSRGIKNKLDTRQDCTRFCQWNRPASSLEDLGLAALNPVTLGQTWMEPVLGQTWMEPVLKQTAQTLTFP